ncbi:MAG: MCE family protein [Rhodospirillales bacterium]|nr:MCE family protein [Rhodospirillales bacterium]
MTRGIVEILAGIAVLILAAGAVALAFRSSGVEAVAGYEIEAEFDNVSGVNLGTEVRLSGVKVGTVVEKSLAEEGDLALLTLSIVADYRIPADSRVRILPEGLLGNNYVQLEPGGALEDMEPGAFVAYDRTQGAINIADLLSRLVVQAADAASAR